MASWGGGSGRLPRSRDLYQSSYSGRMMRRRPFLLRKVKSIYSSVTLNSLTSRAVIPISRHVSTKTAWDHAQVDSCHITPGYKGSRLTLAKSDRFEGGWVLNTSSFVYFPPPQKHQCKISGWEHQGALGCLCRQTKIAAARYFPFFFPSLGEIINDSWYMSQRP
jgi:hypothetical protein